MKVSFKVRKLVSDLFEKNKVLWASEISNILWISRTITHKALNELLEVGKVEKIGKWSHTRYKIVGEFTDVIKEKEVVYQEEYIPDFKAQKLLNDIFLKFTPEGEILEWFSGIKKWCSSRDLDVKDKVKDYISVNNYIEWLQNSCWLLKAKESFWKCFEKVFLDKIFYADQYTWREFWRGKLSELTFYAKQSQNKELINRSIDEIFIKLECIIRKKKFDAIAITPWSIDRKNQLLGFLKDRLKILWIPFVNVIKFYPNNIAIPQKSLKTREQRIQNAKNTIFIDDSEVKKYKKVFLIDDFVGSGSTLNETARKLKEEWVERVIWFAFVWNLDLDYEIINEV